MASINNPRHEFKVAADSDDLQAPLALYLAHPCDENGAPLAEQPTAEKSAELEADNETFKRWASFMRKIAPDVPRTSEE